MPISAFKLVKKPPPAATIYKSYRDETRTDLGKVGDRGVAAYRRPVANWSEQSKPDFRARAESGSKRIRLTIVAIGTAHQLFIWKLVNTTGRKPGPIRPKPGNVRGLLIFPWGGPGSYQSKTGANPARFGGPGTVRNATIRRFKMVDHKGFPPRRFDIPINRDLDPEAKKAIYNGGRRGLRRGKRG